MSQLLEFEGTWEELIVHASEFQGKKLKLMVLPDVDARESAPSLQRAPTARELLKLPLEERDRILSAQAALLAEEYRTNPDLNCFEAFGADDFYDEYPEIPHAISY